MSRRFAIARGGLRRMDGTPGALAVLLVALLALAAPIASAAPVEAPEDIEVFPGAFLVDREALGPAGEQRVPVDRLARADDLVRDESVRRVQGRARSWTWGHGRGVTAEEVFDHLRAQLPGGAWFECRARDCGASTYFANRILGVADLYGRDSAQHYVAVPRNTPDGPGVVMLYVSQRGTREVFAHVEEIVLAADSATPARLASRLGTSLRDAGVARLPRSPFADDGTLARDGVLLDAVVRAIGMLDGDASVWVVVHAVGPVQRALDVSTERARLLAGEIAARSDGRVVESRGVGSLVPAVLGTNELVVELVRGP